MFQTEEKSETTINFENLLDNFLKTYPHAVWIKDENLNLIKANSKYYKYLSKADLISKETNDTNVLKDKRIRAFNLCADDNTNILATIAIPICDKENSDIILYISNNITKEEKLKERFFINKYQLNALLDNIPKIIYMKDLVGNYITGTKFSNDFFLNGFDYFVKLQLDPKSVMKNSMIEDKSVIESNKRLSYETEILDIKGIPHWYKIYKAPINDYNNNVIGIVVMVQNIDQEKLLQAQRETFVASLGHDLKNPTLAQIRALELLLRGEFGEISNEQKEILNMILDSCKYMNAMLGSLLATYRNERGIVKLNYDEFSLINLANDCISEMIYIAKDKNVKISIINNFKNPNVVADKVQIKRVIMNLLSNGIKYAFKNSEIKIKIYNEPELTCLNLENCSPFIPKEKRDAIFAQYVSFADTHKEFGIGLGLYASTQIVNAHGGNIFVESYEDNRNIFGIKIPNSKQSNAQETVSF